MRKLKILVVSNLYPPHYIGGYELGCQDVVERLKARGHDVKVLTSSYGVAEPQQSEEIYRQLKINTPWIDNNPYPPALDNSSSRDLLKLLNKEIVNQRAFKLLCRQFKPDVVYLWNLWHVSVSISSVAQQLGFPVCYFVSDSWLSYWDQDPGHRLWHHCHRRFGRRVVCQLCLSFLNGSGLLLPSGSLDLRYAQFASRFLKQLALQAGKSVANAKVIHWGVDVNRFTYKKPSPGSVKRLLYVGQVVPQKGVHTAVEALKMLVQQHRNTSITLTIVGGSVTPDYEAHVRRLVSSAMLADKVRFTGLLPRHCLSDIYQEHDLLIFPSIWDEPFSITLLEAMASGLAVVGTPTGGSSEILRHEVNAMIFPKEDAGTCAAYVQRLLEDPDLFERIRLNGRQTVEQDFRIEKTVDSIEQSLLEARASRLTATK